MDVADSPSNSHQGNPDIHVSGIDYAIECPMQTILTRPTNLTEMLVAMVRQREQRLEELAKRNRNNRNAQSGHNGTKHGILSSR